MRPSQTQRDRQRQASDKTHKEILTETDRHMQTDRQNHTHRDKLTYIVSDTEMDRARHTKGQTDTNRQKGRHSGIDREIQKHRQ